MTCIDGIDQCPLCERTIWERKCNYMLEHLLLCLDSRIRVASNVHGVEVLRGIGLYELIPVHNVLAQE